MHRDRADGGVIRLVTWRDPGRYQAGRMFRQIAVVHQKLNPLWKFRVTGDVPTDPRRPYVVVANHESFVDILLISHLPIEMKWMSKSEFFKIPLVGLGDADGRRHPARSGRQEGRRAGAASSAATGSTRRSR